MAFTTPETAVAGEVLTAAYLNVIGEDLRVLGGIGVPARSTITNQTTTTTSSSMSDTGLSCSITPSSSTSLVEVTFTVYIGASAVTAYFINLVRGSTNIAQGANCTAGGVHLGSANLDCIAMTFIDSPATTSSTTYKLQWSRTSAATLYLNRRGDSTDVGPISYLQVREIIQP